MMVEAEKKTVSRKKPKFLRTDWHKKIRLGRGLKKKQKWHGAKGRQNKLRLNRKGRGQRPKIGWGSEVESRKDIVRIENVKGLTDIKKGEDIIIASVGMKKRKEIIAKANEMGLKIMNRYKAEKKNEPRTSTDEHGPENKSKSAEVKK